MIHVRFVTCLLICAGLALGCTTTTSPSEARSNAPSTATPSAKPSSPSAAPSATPSPSFEVIGERIAAGTHTATPWAHGRDGVCVGQPGCTESADDDSIRITFTVPDGWALERGVAVTKPSASTEAPRGMSLHFLRGGWLYSDPCFTVDGPPASRSGRVADDFAEALAAHPLLDATTPAETTLGGYLWEYIDLQLPADIAKCPFGYLRGHPRSMPRGRTIDGTSGASMSTVSAW